MLEVGSCAINWSRMILWQKLKRKFGSLGFVCDRNFFGNGLCVVSPSDSKNQTQASHMTFPIINWKTFACSRSISKDVKFLTFRLSLLPASTKSLIICTPWQWYIASWIGPYPSASISFTGEPFSIKCLIHSMLLCLLMLRFKKHVDVEPFFKNVLLKIRPCLMRRSRNGISSSISWFVVRHHHIKSLEMFNVPPHASKM